ncbi:MAG TPA: D-alanyl-D-alanine carboxypeptidase/D-alanyl-D-alanine-endopeptidase [Terriglobia bacterium]|nr:D-alanyl-D-alanine carboxypeptidase/D-alanyl-D-alanine-endopeptidase [Terriglobia bacterium]
MVSPPSTRSLPPSPAGPAKSVLRLLRLPAISLVVVCALLFPLPILSGTEPGVFAGKIESILEASPAGRGFWGIEVVRLSDGEILYMRNPQHLFQPASNMKMFTTSAALSTLGPDFVFRTTVESSAPPDSQGRVPDLILVGRGDPNLGGRVLPYQHNSPERIPADIDFEKLADQVAARGVREVTGDLCADDTYYLYQPYGTDWSVDDLFWDYGAPITSLAFNDNSLMLTIRPAALAGRSAQILMEAGDGYYKIVSNVTTTAAGIPGKVDVNRLPGSMALDIWGHVPVGSNDVDEHISIQDPPLFIGEMFRKLLDQRGVRVDGKVTVRQFTPSQAARKGETQAFAQRVVLAEHDSLPLSQDVKVTLKVSQNLHAEMLLRTMSRVEHNQGSPEDGVNILAGFLQKIGVRPEEIHFEDGSGLSRGTLVTPDAVIKLLQFDARQPWFEAFYDALPVAGIDGTLDNRFHGTPLQGRVHAKTGSLEHVNALSGYMNLPKGRRLAFVIIGNQYAVNWSEATKVIDRIALEIYQHFGYRR